MYVSQCSQNLNGIVYKEIGKLDLESHDTRVNHGQTNEKTIRQKGNILITKSSKY